MEGINGLSAKLTKEEVALLASTLTLFVLMSGNIEEMDGTSPSFDIIAKWSEELQRTTGTVDGEKAAKMSATILDKLVANATA